jgi:hypothetical protein
VGLRIGEAGQEPIRQLRGLQGAHENKFFDPNRIREWMGRGAGPPEQQDGERAVFGDSEAAAGLEDVLDRVGVCCAIDQPNSHFDDRLYGVVGGGPADAETSFDVKTSFIGRLAQGTFLDKAAAFASASVSAGMWVP